MPRFVSLPESLRVDADGTWRTGEAPVSHARSLAYFKAHLVFEDAGAFVVDGARRLLVRVEGPAFEVVRLSVDATRGELRVELDDGSAEPLPPDGLGMDARSGRFECRVRGGRARALLSRGAHQALLEHAVEEDGRFYVRAGTARFPIRT
jgi:hypothetical protein